MNGHSVTSAPPQQGLAPEAPPHALEGVYVVIAAYNEGEMIGDVVRGLAEYLPASRVVVVDDGSADATGDAARAAGAVVLTHAVNRGQGAALATGIAAALRLGAQVVVTFDADGQHDPADLPHMVEPVLKGEADVVLGTRFAPGSASQVPLLRRFLLKSALVVTRFTSRLDITDVHNGFRAMSAEAARKIRIRQSRMEHASEILDQIHEHKLRYVERPVHIRYSEYSVGKGQRNRDAVKLALRILYYKVNG